MPFPRVSLETDRLPNGPWIYARQVLTGAERPEDGSLVEVADASGRFVGHGLYNGRSDVRVRMLSRGRKSDLDRPREFLQRRLAAADRVRRKVLRLHEVTGAYRLAHAEGDDLPGLIVDRLGPVLVCEYHALGFWRLREHVEWALSQLDPEARIVHRVPAGAQRSEGFEPDRGAGGESPVQHERVRFVEYGIEFTVIPAGGHKTGFFCDQRDNRLRIGALARGRDVLDLCCNGGGFALHAAAGGARRVRAVDLDEEVLELARESARRGDFDIDFRHEDAFHTLRRVAGESPRPELIVLDPPKLIHGRARQEEGLKRYLDLNALALAALAPGGLLATFSCSGALDVAGFMGVVFQAARRADRSVRLLEQLGAAPDHPQRPDFPRSRYLKGAILAVD